MDFPVRFSDTQLERGQNCLRLVGKANEVLLELRGHEIDAAERAGFIDQGNCHYSLFEYARIRAIPQDPPGVPGDVRPTGASGDSFDRAFLSDLHISWD